MVPAVGAPVGHGEGGLGSRPPKRVRGGGRVHVYDPTGGTCPHHPPPTLQHVSQDSQALTGRLGHAQSQWSLHSIDEGFPSPPGPNDSTNSPLSRQPMRKAHASKLRAWIWRQASALFMSRENNCDLKAGTCRVVATLQSQLFATPPSTNERTALPSRACDTQQLQSLKSGECSLVLSPPLSKCRPHESYIYSMMATPPRMGNTSRGCHNSDLTSPRKQNTASITPAPGRRGEPRHCRHTSASIRDDNEASSCA